MEGKSFLKSKTFWVNLVAVGASLASGLGFDAVAQMQTEITTAVLAAANIALRFLTKEPVRLN